jgi:hypothetical protein
MHLICEPDIELAHNLKLNVMKKKIAMLLAAGLFFAVATQAEGRFDGRRDIRHDRMEVRHDRRDIRFERRDIRFDRRHCF